MAAFAESLWPLFEIHHVTVVFTRTDSVLIIIFIIMLRAEERKKVFQDPERQEVQLRKTNGPLRQFHGASSARQGR